jgi:uncharacterized protein (UPF0210 family)
MLKTSDILSTLRMFQEENLDVRTVTMGINLLDCADRSPETMLRLAGDKIRERAGDLVRVCDDMSARYGIPIVNKRLAISPASQLLEGHDLPTALALAKALDQAVADVGVDLLGGFSALVHKGITPGERILLKALPQVLAETTRICASINVGTTKAGINVDAVQLAGQTILDAAEATRDNGGFGAAKIVVFANIPEDNPFMAGAYLGAGEADCVINVGVSGPGVVKRAIDRLLQDKPDAKLDEIAEAVKHTTYRVTRTGELIAREVAARLSVPFGVLDLSLAPTPRVGDSVGEIYQAMGVTTLGAPGTTAAVALLNDAVKKGGAFASSAVGGLSGAFIPVMEDHALSAAVTNGTLTLEKLEAMTAVCSVGLDMILLPGDTTLATICGIILDEAAIGVTNRKTTGVRAIPVPGAKRGDFIDYGGLFGSGTICDVNAPDGAGEFIMRGGRIPAPLTSLSN